MTLKERIKKLADAQGLSLPALEAKLGFGNSTIVKWDKSTPNAEKLNTVAQFFGVSMDYLMTGKDSSARSAATQATTPQLTARDERDIARDLERIMEKLSNEEDGPASFEGEDIPEADREMFAAQVEIMLRRLKGINKELYNPNKNKK